LPHFETCIMPPIMMNDLHYYCISFMEAKAIA
jgi:hypothetical protein